MLYNLVDHSLHGEAAKRPPRLVIYLAAILFSKSEAPSRVPTPVLWMCKLSPKKENAHLDKNIE